jgi:hypothetical protein
MIRKYTKNIKMFLVSRQKQTNFKYLIERNLKDIKLHVGCSKTLQNIECFWSVKICIPQMIIYYPQFEKEKAVRKHL